MTKKIYPVNPAADPTPDASADRAPEMDALLKLVLDEDRLAILGLIALHPQTVRALDEALPGHRTPVAKHVAQLVDAGLLVSADGDNYTLNVRQVQAWKRTLFARPARPKPESSEEQVLATFVRDGKLVQYPAQPAKRLVVLRWLATQFAPERSYTEREVNEMLDGHSEDYATLRRYLVNFELLTRQAGIYRRAKS